MIELNGNMCDKIDDLLLEFDDKIKLDTSIDEWYDQDRYEIGWWDLTFPNIFTVEMMESLPEDSIYLIIDRKLNDAGCPIEKYMERDMQRKIKINQDDEKTVYSIPYYFDKSEVFPKGYRKMH